MTNMTQLLHGFRLSHDLAFWRKKNTVQAPVSASNAKFTIAVWPLFNQSTPSGNVLWAHSVCSGTTLPCFFDNAMFPLVSPLTIFTWNHCLWYSSAKLAHHIIQKENYWEQNQALAVLAYEDMMESPQMA